MTSVSFCDKLQWTGEKFTTGMAWVDLQLLAENGIVNSSFRALSVRWKWSPNRVVRFINFLEAEKMVEMSHGTFHGTITEQIIRIKSDDYKDNGTITECSTEHKEEPLNGPSPIPTLPFPPTPPITHTPVTTPPIIPQEKRADVREEVERIYKLYPTKCPVKGRPTGKSSSDKKKIERELKKYGEEKLTNTIKRYLKECMDSQTPIKNFSTFLNNVPDYESEPAGQFDKPWKQKGTLYNIMDFTQHMSNGEYADMPLEIKGALTSRKSVMWDGNKFIVPNNG